MTTEEKFRAAVNVIRSLPKNGSYQPSHELMLRFYGYFKQATEGPCSAPKPAFWEVVRKMKWDAWCRLGNMARDEAMDNYVEELKKIVETMSYTDNVASFLGSLGSFYDTVPVEDLELLVGPVIERIRSQPGSPLSSSPLGSREASPNRVQSAPSGRTHIMSSLETSPASSYSASPLPPDEDEEDDEEFIDTVETEPERIKDTPSLKKPTAIHNHISNNNIPNGHAPPLMNGLTNGHHNHNGTGEDMALTNSNPRGRARERGSPQVKRASWKMEDAAPLKEPAFVELESAPDAFMDVPARSDKQRTAHVADISEPILEAVLRLQRDLERVNNRLNSLEAASASTNRSQVRLRSGRPAWWPSADISPRMFAILILWPFVVHATIAWLQRRRHNRLL